MISKANEEYLKNIYVINKQNGHVRVTDIAEKMNCTKPSVNKAIKNLKEHGFIDYETYGEIKILSEGENLAKKILEAYDIVYLFLQEVLELDEEEAKIEAEKMKMSMSDNTLNKLARYVHNELDLNDLNCNYNLNYEECRRCAKKNLDKIKLKNK